MTEEEPFQIVKLRQPTQCILWEHPGRVAGQFAQAFEVVESYEDGSHLSGGDRKKPRDGRGPYRLPLTTAHE